MIASLLAVVLLSNILAFWPQVYNLAAIKFLVKSRELSKNEDVQMYKQSVVVVSAGDSKGTGFNISSDGTIVTNHHVIDGEEFVVIRFPDGESHQADVIHSDPSIDIAILKIDDSEVLDLPKLTIEFNQTEENDIPVYIIGNPLFFDYIANEGSIIGETLIQDWNEPVYMIQAPIYKGNSGSPVINHEGKVIGVVFATTKVVHDGSTKKVGLAVPVEYFEEYVE